MGCSNEKMTKVAPAGGVIEVKSVAKSSQHIQSQIGASSTSLASGDRPVGSATSKGTKHSQDSGYSGNDLEDNDIDEYANIITENSDGAVIAEIESKFQPQELDLCLNGIPAPRNLSAKDKARLDEQRILESLRNEGLIATAKYEAKSGLAFDVVEASAGMRRALPARLAKLDKKKKKKKTKEEIAEKLAKAEQRRKEAENEKLVKINAVTSKSDVSHVHDDQVKQQQQLLENTIKKVDLVAENREQKLQELRDKQKAREERASKVRLRKKLHIPTEEELEEYEKILIEQQQQKRAALEQQQQIDNPAIQDNKLKPEPMITEAAQPVSTDTTES